VAVEVIDGERVGGIVDIADRQSDDIGPECSDLLAQIPQGMLAETQVGNGDFMPGLLRGGGDIAQAERKDRVRKVFPVGGDEQDPSLNPRPLGSRAGFLPCHVHDGFMKGSFLLQ
jgi:hypothetical protein